MAELGPSTASSDLSTAAAAAAAPAAAVYQACNLAQEQGSCLALHCLLLPVEASPAYRWMVLSWVYNGCRPRMALQSVTRLQEPQLPGTPAAAAPWLSWSPADVLPPGQQQAGVWTGGPGGLCPGVTWQPSREQCLV